MDFSLLWAPSGSFSLRLVISLPLVPGGLKTLVLKFCLLESDLERTSGAAGLGMTGAEVNTHFDQHLCCFAASFKGEADFDLSNGSP